MSGSSERAGGALAAAEDVGADDERAVGVERAAGTDERLPPAAVAAGAAVAGEGVEDENGVVARGVQPAPGAVGEGDVSRRPPSSRSSAPISIVAAGLETSAGLGRGAPRAGELAAALLVGLDSVRLFNHLLAVSRLTSPVHGSVFNATSRGRGTAHKNTPAEAGVRIHAVPLSRRSLCRNWHLAAIAAGCRASQGRFPPPVSIRQHSSVVDQESTE